MSLNKKLDNEGLVLTTLREFIQNEGYSPTFRELEEATGISLGMVHETLHNLRDSGKITFQDRKARTLKIAKGK